MREQFRRLTAGLGWDARRRARIHELRGRVRRADPWLESDGDAVAELTHELRAMSAAIQAAAGVLGDRRPLAAAIA